MNDKTSPKRILIVEDEIVLLELMRDKFVREGFTVYTARDGEEGLTVGFREHPDLILLDLLMPKMDGVTMMEKMTGDEWGKSVPIIVLSNIDLRNDQTKDILTHRPAEYLTKANVGINDIVAKVKKILAR